MRNHLNSIIDAWVELYNPNVSKKEIEALKDTIYVTAYQYINDTDNNRRKWNKK